MMKLEIGFFLSQIEYGDRKSIYDKNQKCLAKFEWDGGMEMQLDITKIPHL